MKTKLNLLMTLALLTAPGLCAATDILSENVRDYRKSVDGVINRYVSTGQSPSIDQALSIQACENDMLALARLDPSVADSLPELLLANHARLQDLRHLPGELVVGRAKTAGIDVLVPQWGNRQIEYVKGTVFPRTKTFSVPGADSAFPAREDWAAQHAYALHCLTAGEYQQAAEHFEKALAVKHAKKGTKSQVWEFENLVSAPGRIFFGQSGQIPRGTRPIIKLVVDAPFEEGPLPQGRASCPTGPVSGHGSTTALPKDNPVHRPIS